MNILCTFHISVSWVWYSQSDSKSYKFSRTLLSILTDFNGFDSSSNLLFSQSFSKPFQIVTSAPTTSGISLTVRFYSFSALR